MSRAAKKLALKDARRVQRAEAWLRLGKPVRALRQLNNVTAGAWTHPSTESLVWRAARALVEARDTKKPAAAGLRVGKAVRV